MYFEGMPAEQLCFELDDAVNMVRALLALFGAAGAPRARAVRVLPGLQPRQRFVPGPFVVQPTVSTRCRVTTHIIQPIPPCAARFRVKHPSAV
jgi:hypothetical protein